MKNISNCIYKFLDNNENVLYVGKTKSLVSRLRTHTHLPNETYEKTNKIMYISFPSYLDAGIMERAFIAHYKPPYNEQYMHEGDVSIFSDGLLETLTWKEYDGNINSHKADNTPICISEPQLCYQKSNTFVNLIACSNLMVQKIFAIGIAQAVEDKETGILTATIRGVDLRKIFKKTNGSFYDQIKEAVVPVDNRQTLNSFRMTYVNDITQKVEVINPITFCEFENGILTIRFNSKINNHIHNLKSDYTVYSLNEIIPLKNPYSLRLYEILKAVYDGQKVKDNGNSSYMIDIDMQDLKTKLGILDKSDNNDFSIFRRTALDAPKKELKKYTSICFDYQPIRTGRGGKTTAIRFFIRKNIDTTKEIPIVIDSAESSMETDDKLEILFEIKSALGTDFSMKDARIIAEKANYDFYKVRDALEVLNVSQGEIKNPVAWILKAIEGNYQMPKPKKAKNNFVNFEQTSIDFDELEKKLVEN